MKRLALLLLVLLAALPALAAPSAKEVLAKADRARGNGPGLVWTVEMSSTEAGEAKDETLEVRARGADALVTFQAPARVKGQKLLMVGRNMWFVKPGVSKPIPISPRQKLMGQAANGDIASTNYAGDYEGTFLPDETVAGEECWVLDLAAKANNLTYDKIVLWISKKKGVGMKADFYTVSGKKFKSAVFEHGNTAVVGGETVPFVSKMTITDALRPADSTTLKFGKVSVKEVPDSTFNLNLLVK